MGHIRNAPELHFLATVEVPLPLAIASILTLVADASATTPLPCDTPDLFVVYPEADAVDVPLDVVPVALPAEGACEYVEWVGTLLVTTTQEVVATGVNADDPHFMEVDPGGDLLADTAYTLRLESDGGNGAIEELRFTTGRGYTAGLVTEPTIRSARMELEQPNLLRLQAEIDVAAAAEGLSIVTFGIRGQANLEHTADIGPATLQLVGHSRAYETIPEEEVCITARQRDAAGRWTESAPHCISPPGAEMAGGGCGCGTDGAPRGGMFGLLVAVGLAWRGRR